MLNMSLENEITVESTRALQFLVCTWRHGGHVGVQNNGEKSLLGIWPYYYAKLERHFAIVLYTNMSAQSRATQE